MTLRTTCLAISLNQPAGRVFGHQKEFRKNDQNIKNQKAMQYDLDRTSIHKCMDLRLPIVTAMGLNCEVSNTRSLQDSIVYSSICDFVPVVYVRVQFGSHIGLT
mmetsp:Transcript_15411/g.31607  ORF Transcript_15411/g.31607 Transcript_15411/m.31607 type:complete len:104 (-) Transcript_15411:186-497(-)